MVHRVGSGKPLNIRERRCLKLLISWGKAIGMKTRPIQLGVAFCVHILESFAKYVAPELGWKPNWEGNVEGDAT